MPRSISTLLACVLVAKIAYGAWWWYAHMELRWTAQERISEAARENDMLAATMLLRQNGSSVTIAGSLAELPLVTIPDGTLIVAQEGGVVSQQRARQMLAWVQRGNTLITQPRWVNAVERAELEQRAKTAPPATAAPAAGEPAGEGEEEEEEGEEGEEAEQEDEEAAEEEGTADEDEKALAELVEVDPIAARLDVRLVGVPKLSYCMRSPDFIAKGHADRQAVALNCVASVTVPGMSYPLAVRRSNAKLFSMDDAAKPLWADPESANLRVYREGKGHIVMVGAEFFNNQWLRYHDHAELLLALARLNGASSQVTIVRSLDIVAWYEALWKHFSMVLISVVTGLVLLFWAAVRRFGPMLPRPGAERRSLIEHIEASGAWLWKAEGGRQLLLDAARADTLALIARRAPALFRLPADELPTALARITGQHASNVTEALHQDAARQSAHFTRQIRTLQELRTHYER